MKAVFLQGLSTYLLVQAYERHVDLLSRQLKQGAGHAQDQDRGAQALLSHLQAAEKVKSALAACCLALGLQSAAAPLSCMQAQALPAPACKLLRGELATCCLAWCCCHMHTLLELCRVGRNLPAATNFLVLCRLALRQRSTGMRCRGEGKCVE